MSRRRGPQDDPRTERTSTRWTVDEVELLRAGAAAEGLDPSDLVRRATLDYVRDAVRRRAERKARNEARTPTP